MAAAPVTALLLVGWANEAIAHFQRAEGAASLYGLANEGWYRFWGGRAQLGIGTIALVLIPLVSLRFYRGRRAASAAGVLAAWSVFVWLALAHALWTSSGPLYE